MKVLWVTSAYPSDKQPGNGVFHETQVQELKKQGIEVTVICPVPYHSPILRLLKKKYQLTPTSSIYERNGITVYSPKYTAYPGQLRWSQPDQRIAKAVLAAIKENNLTFDLLHAHFAMPSGGACRRVAKEIKKPWVLTLHGSDVHIYPSFSKGAEKIFCKTVLSADKVITVGKNLADKAKDKTGRDSIVLPIGIDLSKFSHPLISKRHVKKQLNLPEDKKIIIFVGRLVKEKGIFELAESLAYLAKDTVVFFIGDGPGGEGLKQHPMYNKQLFLLGQMENERIVDYMYASDIFALPSYSEGMPTVIIEAISLKIPVVCTRVGGVPDLFGKYKDKLIEPKSVKSLAVRLNEYLTKQEVASTLCEELYEHVQKHYGAKKNAERLIDHYASLISSGEKETRVLEEPSIITG
ncbi:teichuronic acid biosynthesis protein TuaC [Niallia nealsonii]|uniref:Glycosyltransferase family 4 protein n=1 Tax=Niallia nealsonii TaxID=115979 RepID=A0A2N0YYE8_9BACI|nr:glycosyltransferase family 4 protein [Niallia nealsonii]PKG22287.1 glycosyltransferase family 4 protein [Niallia nealsonii]